LKIGHARAIRTARPAHGRFRVLNIVYDVTKECLGAIADVSLSGRRVIRELDHIISRRGAPEMIVSDNEREFTSNAVLEWVQEIAAGKKSFVGHHVLSALRASV